MSSAIPEPAWIRAGEAAITKAGELLQASTARMRDTERIEERGKETKIFADQLLHDSITEILSSTGLPIRSEEGDTTLPADHQWCWVIDPLDGSANFQRGFSLCASSIALCHGIQPAAGFVYDVHTRTIITGGQGIAPSATLRCPATTTLDRAILCTGIPARLQWSPENTMLFSAMFQHFYKIRMLGSAVQALLHVATGKADVYFERNIMFWDVAAAWALAESTGIRICTRPGTREGSLEMLVAPPALMPLCQPLLMP
jgi:myo-inositol-1(or 4)-monophosphatase